MRKPFPKVSIGLPVYNGEKYLAKTIDSLLGQTFGDFEVIICDNASSDSTDAICRDYARMDKRVRYYRHAENIGAAANFNGTFELASGEYFKWAAHDDLLAPEFLNKCAMVLEKDHSVVLCHSEVQFIDAHGSFVQTRDVLLPNRGSWVSHLRFADLISTRHWCIDIFGLIRTEALKRTPLIETYVGSDRVTLARLALMGRLHRIPEVLFFSRDHAERSVRKFRRVERTGWFDPKKRNSIAFPHWRVLVEYVKVIRAADLRWQDRVPCYCHLVAWVNSNTKLLKQDLKAGSRHIRDRFRTPVRGGR